MNELETRRRALRMTKEALSQRSGVSLATVSRILNGASCSFANHVAVAEALGLKFGFQPIMAPSEMREAKATEKARAVVSVVQGTSALEHQGIDQEAADAILDRARRDLLASERRLWE